jgi:hypothetical protein
MPPQSHAEQPGASLPPPALLSSNPLRWLAIFGPGAVIASLTIGVGELVFSSRGGAIFGYRLLWYFVLVLLLKWVLVFASARHIVLTGAHPFQRSMDLPGPRGWFPMVLFLLALPCFPIWVCFHAGTLGTLISELAGTKATLGGSAYLLWGMAILGGVLVLSFKGGYQALEKIQLVIVLLMLTAVALALFFVRVDWLAFARGFFIPQALQYPAWINSYPDIASRPVWVELATYVGVIGGSSYDYLAYVSYLRDKRWGRAAMRVTPTAQLDSLGPEARRAAWQWLRAPLVDCTLSFLAVLIFMAVFLALGSAVLGPQHKVPAGMNLLSLQAEFVTGVHPWLKYVYFSGAFLAVLGTLYGTIEVAPAVFRELMMAFHANDASKLHSKLRFWSVAWVGFGGFVVLLASFAHHLANSSLGVTSPPGLIAILTPANLFTGVLGCGLVCLLNVWMDRQFLSANWRMGWPLRWLSLLAAVLFVALGIKSYWDHSRWIALLILAGTLALGWIGARVAAKFISAIPRASDPQAADIESRLSSQ